MAGESAREAAERQRAKAERLLRSAELYERGAEGEEQTKRALDQLPKDSWTLIHDVRWPGRRLANIDHIAIGPPGVFVIDSKNWSGGVTLRDSVLRQDGHKRDSTVAGAAEAAIAVAQLTGVVRADQVIPVLCFVRDEPLSGWARDVMVTSTTNVVSMLMSRPAVLSPKQVRDVSLHLDAQLLSALSPPTPARPASPRGGRATRARHQRRAPAKASSAATRRAEQRSLNKIRFVLAAGFLAVLVLAPTFTTNVLQSFIQFVMKS